MADLPAEARERLTAKILTSDLSVDESSWMWGGHIIEFLALGTAVVRGQATGALTPQVVLGLDA